MRVKLRACGARGCLIKGVACTMNGRSFTSKQMIDKSEGVVIEQGMEAFGAKPLRQ